MASFVRSQLWSGVVSPSSPPSAPRGGPDARRPSAPSSTALRPTTQTYGLDEDALRGFIRPAYFALGGLSNPDRFPEERSRLAAILPNFWVELFPERHHLDPPYRVNR
jgi:hypothetical protein